MGAVVVVFVVAIGGALAAAAAGALPDAPVVLEDERAGIGIDFDVALDERGRIFRRARSAGSTWRLLPPAGVPAPKGRIEQIKELVPLLRTFAAPSKIDAISVDGENLIAIGDGRVYYAKLGTAVDAQLDAPLDWDDVWGLPAFAAPLSLPARHKGFAISHRKLPYADVDGNAHPISAGVTTLYALTDDDRIVYADPWLPNGFDHELCGPARGRVGLLSLAASASTLAVMDEGGTVHTRLADFDTTGNNPALPYSWRRERRSGVLENIRSLPGEEWRAQPPIPGPHTSALTVVQQAPRAGMNPNDARLLRVQGAGDVYFEKALRDPSWRKRTGAGASSISGAIVVDQPAALRAPRGRTLRGKVGKVEVSVEDFRLACPGAEVIARRDGEEVRFILHWTDRIVDPANLIHRDRRAGALLLVGGPAAARGAGALADEIEAELGTAPNGPRFVEVELEVRGDGTVVVSAEPAFQGERVVLR